MVKSFSNLGTGFSLDVALLPVEPGDKKPYLSITPPNFPENGMVDLIESHDQQLVYLDTLIDDFIKTNTDDSEKVKMADSLELLADNVRGGSTTSTCSSCNKEIEPGAPWIEHENLLLCSGCYINLIPKIFKMSGMGDGGVIDILFEECVKLKFNLKYKKNFIPFSKLEERIAKNFGSSNETE